MAQNHSHPGKVLTLTVPSGGCVSGTAYLFGTKLAIALHTKAAGKKGEFAVEDCWMIPKAAPLVINEMDALYWDATNKVVNKTSSGNTLIGFASASALSAAVTVEVKINA